MNLQNVRSEIISFHRVDVDLIRRLNAPRLIKNARLHLHLKMDASWNIAPYCLVDVDRRFRCSSVVRSWDRNMAMQFRAPR